MKKLMSIKYTEWSFSLALLVMRVSLSAMMMPHGYQKLLHYAEKKDSFMNFMGLGAPVSMALIIFAEFICSGFVALGLFTRLAVIPLIIGMSVALLKAHGGDFLGDGQTATLYLTGYVAILLLGPGKISADAFAK